MANLDEIFNLLEQPAGTSLGALAGECRSRIAAAEAQLRTTTSKPAKKGIEARLDRLRKSLALVQSEMDSERVNGVLAELERAIADKRANRARFHYEEVNKLQSSLTELQRQKLRALAADAEDFGLNITGPSAAELEARRAAAEREAQRIAAEKEAQRIAAEKEAQRVAAEKEAQRLAAEREAQRLAAEREAQRVAAEQEARRVAAEKEAQSIAEEKAAKEKEEQRHAAEQEAQRLAAEKEAQRLAAEQEARRIAAEKEAQRVAAEKEAQRIAAEREAKRIADEREARRVAAEAEEKRKAAERATKSTPAPVTLQAAPPLVEPASPAPPVVGQRPSVEKPEPARPPPVKPAPQRQPWEPPPPARQDAVVQKEAPVQKPTPASPAKLPDDALALAPTLKQAKIPPAPGPPQKEPPSPAPEKPSVPAPKPAVTRVPEEPPAPRRKRSLAVLAVVAVLLCALAVTGLVKWMGSRPVAPIPVPATVAVAELTVTTTNPKSARVRLGNEPMTATPATFSITNPQPNLTLELSQDGYQTLTTNITLQPGGKSSLELALAPAVSYLRLTCNEPGAAIYVNKTAVGTTGYAPTMLKLEPFTGTTNLQVEVVKQGFTASPVAVEVSAGETNKSVDVIMTQVATTATLFVISTPAGGTITINGTLMTGTTTPALVTVDAPQDRVTVTVGGIKGYRAATKNSSGIKAGETNTIDVGSLEALPGSLYVLSDPVTAQVYTNGYLAGTTLQKITGLAAGHYRLRVTSSGYQDRETSVDLAPGEDRVTDTIVLKRAVGRIRVKSQPAASVFLGGTSTGKTTECVLEDVPVETNLVVAVSLADYLPTNRVVRLSADGPAEETIDFRRLQKVAAPPLVVATNQTPIMQPASPWTWNSNGPGTVGMETLVVRVVPRDAHIFFDHDAYAVPSPNGEARLAGAYSGSTHHLKAELDGYITKELDFQFSPGETKILPLTLEIGILPYLRQYYNTLNDVYQTIPQRRYSRAQQAKLLSELAKFKRDNRAAIDGSREAQNYVQRIEKLLQSLGPYGSGGGRPPVF